MKFKSVACPKPFEGIDYSKVVDQVVPDQSMSLREILERFTRGEALPVGMEVQQGDDDLDNPLNVDLEKMAAADLVDKAEYSRKLDEVRQKYENQEKKKTQKVEREKAEAAKIAHEKRISEEVEKRLKDKSA